MCWLFIGMLIGSYLSMCFASKSPCFLVPKMGMGQKPGSSLFTSLVFLDLPPMVPQLLTYLQIQNQRLFGCNSSAWAAKKVRIWLDGTWVYFWSSSTKGLKILAYHLGNLRELLRNGCLRCYSPPISNIMPRASTKISSHLYKCNSKNDENILESPFR